MARCSPLRRMCPVRDRARELRQLELVAEEPRRESLPCLDRVDGRRARRRRSRAGSAARARSTSDANLASGRRLLRVAAAASLGGGAEHDARVEVGLPAHEAARDPGPPARLEHDASSRSRGASGIVTSTASGRAARSPSRFVERRRARACPAVRRFAARGRRRRSRRRCSPAVSRSSRSRLRPLRPAPTMSVRCCSPRPRSDARPRTSARSANRDAPMRNVHSNASITNVARGKPIHGLRRGERSRPRPSRRRRPLRRRWPRRARPRSARRRDRGRRG